MAIRIRAHSRQHGYRKCRHWHHRLRGVGNRLPGVDGEESQRRSQTPGDVAAKGRLLHRAFRPINGWWLEDLRQHPSLVRHPCRRAKKMQRAMSLAQKRQPIKPPQRVVPPPIRAAAPVAKQQSVAASASSRPVVEKVVSSAASNIARSNLAGAKAPAIRKWLVPATLRKQFILTELFRPPIGLRSQFRKDSTCWTPAAQGTLPVYACN